MAAPAVFTRLPLLADGGLADLLARRQPDWRQPLPALNQFRPEAVQALQREFAAAGARLLRTHTEGATALQLAPHGLAERAEAINNSGSALARSALRADGAVMGTLGPPPRPGLVHEPTWQRAQAEQVIYLSDTGVDFFLLQHFTRLEDAEVVTRRVCQLSDAPVLAALQLDAAGRTADGWAAGPAGERLAEAGAGALGLSCAPGPAALAACLESLRAPGLPLAVLAGLDSGAGPPPWPAAPRLTPAEFAAWLAPLAAAGVAILGGCCGCTPAHIRALAEVLASAPAPDRGAGGSGAG